MALLAWIDINAAKAIRSLVIALLIVGAGISWCGASSLQMSPIRLEIPSGANATALNLQNKGDNAIHLQLRVFRWTQAMGEDVLTPSEEIVVSPPFIVIEPGQEQLIRIMRTPDTPSGTEVNYRLLVDEIPDAKANPQIGVQLRMRHSLPVFVNRSNTTPAEVTFSLQTAGDTWQLLATNSSTRSAQIREAEIINAQGKVILAEPELIGYALPGSQRIWPLKTTDGFTGKGGLFIRIKINNKTLELPLNIQTPR